MAEYDLTPLDITEDVQSTYELLRSYFIRDNNLFNMVADFVNEDGFTIDIIRSYSVIASYPQEVMVVMMRFHMTLTPRLPNWPPAR